MKSAKCKAQNDRRKFLLHFALCTLHFALCTSLVAADRPLGAARARPNVILIMTDDQGYGDLSVTGNPILKTPNTDRLASQGVWLNRFYVCPVCNPTRASLMTGRYNYRTRSIDTFVGRAMMDPREVTVAEILRDAGYATGIFGKWHLGDCYPMRPGDQGFTESLVLKGGGLRQPANPPEGEGYFDPILWHNGKPQRHKGWCSDIFFEAATRFIEQNHAAGKPFFAYIPTNAVHEPLDEVPRKLYEHYKALANDHDARVYAMAANIDDNIGRLMGRLDELKLADDTLVIYLQDNGPQRARFNAKLKGLKGGVYEGGIRSPFFVRWPARLKHAEIAAIHAAHIDVTPTILEACRVPPPGSVKMDGRSLMPVLRGDTTGWPDRTLFTQWRRGDVPVRYRNFAAIGARWKLLEGMSQPTTAGDGKFELYDLQEDPGEEHDVSAEHPEILADLKKQYDAWFDDVSHTRPDNYAPPRIVIGHEGTSPVILTPQDLRMLTKAEGWAGPGQWLVQIESARPYIVRCRLKKPLTGSAVCQLSIGQATHRLDLPPGSAEGVFEGVQLPPGDTSLRATTVQNVSGKAVTANVFQVEVSW